MTNKEILSHIDHTLLKQFATWEEITVICDDAITYETASVCIPPTYVKKIKETYGDKLNICTVIGFPLGYNTTATKVFEAVEAVNNGASEIDMVINITALKNKDYEVVQNEIAEIKQAIGDKILKVIVETCFLTEAEKVTVCKLVTNAKADYIKTSTGFGTAGATIEDIRLFKANIGPAVKMKAAGGVKSVDDLIAFINEGCARIGTSSAVKLLKGETAGNY
ncbi:deoxyribose-phosphate aldolase [Acetobacterium carbinolicum]|jgi:deoxyribose-phosphate aldolase|uniref:deoxyribose-phosphate aldolase n=1 Tax=Acetobacterium TaxID=33951 RepID=UPI000DBEBAAF|nr:MULTISPECIES: deoxyribose-phosphate aldolase [unclassified Acetobacterium]AWW27245.1 deoxyribose-phosphate aldolase [Acetobacterium sp. KB-1]MDK2942358.1 deoxyribose-phosphate aldolase [Acetobacterium sp.]MDZ5724450.1 deoxyribose-phosphate aldolase [Acetobacterium sp. K1/6]